MINIEKKIVFNPFGGDPAVFYHDLDTGSKYRRIAGGLAWPGIKPGFAVIIAEDFVKDSILKTHHLRLLEELEESELERILQRLDMIGANAQDVSWTFFSDTGNTPGMEFYFNHVERFYEQAPTGFSIEAAPFVDDPNGFAFCVNVLKKHLNAGRKTLHLGHLSKLPGYLMELEPGEIKNASSEDYPAIAALGFAVSALTIWPQAGIYVYC